MHEITEADESATSKTRALANLHEQVLNGETMGIVSMYELAAMSAGANFYEVWATVALAYNTRCQKER
jgi:hypothetical protein